MSGESSGVLFPIERSTYYQHWLVEKAAMETHKWYLSERAGHDVGWEYTTWSWSMHGYRARWLAENNR